MADTLSDAEAQKLFRSHRKPTMSDAEAQKAFRSSVGEPGNASHNQYGEEQQKIDAEKNAEPTLPEGTMADAAKTWANKAAIGAGPQIAGAMGALAEEATAPLSHPNSPPDSLGAYRSVRDDTARQLQQSENTRLGHVAVPLGAMSTPLPVKSTAGMTLGERAWQAGKVGGGIGLVSGAAQSHGDLTKLDSGNLKRVLLDALMSGAGGFLGGVTAGALSRAPAALGEEASAGAGKLALGSLNMTPAQRAGLAASGKGQQAAGALLGSGSKPGLLGFSRGGTAEHVAHELDSAGGAIGDIKDAIDARKGGATVLPDVMADDIEAAARAHGNAATPEEAGTPEAAAVMRDMLARAERARNFGGGKPISLADAEANFKSPLNDVARKVRSSTTEPPSSALARQLTRDAVAGSNERAAEAGLSALKPELAGKYGPAKERYGVAKELARILEKSEPEAFAKRGLEPISLPSFDLDIGAGTQGIGGGIRGFAGRQLRNIAAPAAAKGLNAGGRALQSTPTGGKLAGGLAPYLELLQEEKDGGQ